MRLRLVTAGAVILGLAASTAPAVAAVKKPAPKKPTCRLVTDVEGDGRATAGAGIIKSDAIDVISADMSTGTRYLKAVVRLKSSEYKDTWSTFGYKWAFVFKIAGLQYSFTASANKNSTTPTVHFTLPDRSFSDAGLTGKIENNTVWWQIPKSKLAAPLRKSKIFTEFSANTGWYNNNADGAGTRGAKYTDLWPSCIGNK